MSDRIMNYGAGPAMLPESVLESVRDEILSYRRTGVGILEHSHRGSEISDLLKQTESLVRTLANIPLDYDVLFLTSGASTQFALVPLNFLDRGQIADYVYSGPWTKLAIAEAERIGNVNVVASGEASRFRLLPDSIRVTPDAAYLHYTSNETSLGTQFAEAPLSEGVPIVCDACSDLFSRTFDVRRFGLIYASAQKNLGTSGVSLVIIRRDLVDRGSIALPKIFQYRTHVKAGSRYNTAPVFSLLVMNRMLEWIAWNGGLLGMEKQNREKSQIVYRFLDSSEVFRGMVDPSCRSMVSVTFTTGSPKLDDEFSQICQHEGSHIPSRSPVGGWAAGKFLQRHAARGC